MAAATGIAVMSTAARAQTAEPLGLDPDPPGRQAPTADLVFDLPPLPLHEALQRYSRQTRLSVLYDTAQVTGKRSSAVSGRYTEKDALMRLLAGTGMAARYTSQRAFLLIPQPQGDRPPAAKAPADEAARGRYAGQLQRRIVAALCKDPALQAGRYRLALRFWIEGGAIGKLQIHATGRADLEPGLRTALSGLAVGAPPPAFAQPATMLLTPEAARRHGSCLP